MEIYHNKELSLQPLISAYTIIGRNVRLLEQWLKCVRERSGMKPFEYEIDLVLWDPADDILQYVNDNEIRHTVYDSSKHEYNGHPDHRFVFDLYNCWQIGTEMSRATYVLRSGSDQLFSKEFLSNSMDLILNYEYELTDEGFKPREQFCMPFITFIRWKVGMAPRLHMGVLALAISCPSTGIGHILILIGGVLISFAMQCHTQFC